MTKLIKIKNLYVETNGKKILNGVNLEINQGEVQALLGPNASGKSTLAYTILGLPNYKVKKGKIFWGKKEIGKLAIEERSKLGIALVWQSPPSIEGVTLSQFLRNIAKIKFDNKNLGLDFRFTKREVNLDLSGGEKKLSELLQVLYLAPKLLILDEIDSGLDVKNLEKVVKVIKKEFINKGVAVLLITHSGSILKYLKPKITNVMVKGKIICKEKNYLKVLRTIKKFGYEKCKKCELLAD
jgi:Fe-S cluster assembly ATP-binding protein